MWWQTLTYHKLLKCGGNPVCFSSSLLSSQLVVVVGRLSLNDVEKHYSLLSTPHSCSYRAPDPMTEGYGGQPLLKRKVAGMGPYMKA